MGFIKQVFSHPNKYSIETVPTACVIQRKLGITSEVKHATECQGVLNLSSDFAIFSLEVVKVHVKRDQ